jgi:hypothetical protein
VVALSLFLAIHAFNHLPFVDFRAYRIGNNIPEQMKPQEQPVIEYVFEKDGKEISSEKYLSEPGYKYISSKVPLKFHGICETFASPFESQISTSMLLKLYIPDHEDPPFLFMRTHHSWHGDPA